MRSLLTLAAVILVALCSVASADTITSYSDQASWETAVAGDTIGPYTGSVTITDTRTTFENPCSDTCGDCPDVGCMFSSVTSEPPAFNLSSFFTSFNGCDTTATSCTVITDATIHFNTPIDGLEALNGSCTVADVTVNGGAAEFPLLVYGCFVPETKFFGLAGPISSITYSGYNNCSPFNGCGDDTNVIALGDIEVATVPVPEPFTILLFSAGLVGLLAFRRRAHTALRC